MDLTSKTAIKNLLKSRGLQPLKRLGQNFLIDKFVLKKIVEAADLLPQDIILEIGPGIGTLTQELAKRVKKVIAAEKDQNMVEILKETLKGFGNVEVIRGDILKIGNWKLEIGNSFKVVANLPFYLTAPVIRKFLENTGVQPRQLVLVVQKEVAQRICAKPPDMNLLAVSVQFYSEPKIISFVSKSSFWPQPDVDAAVIKIISRQFRVPVSRQFRERFFRIVKAGFSQPRKQLINNLSKKLNIDKKEAERWLLKNKIRPTQRAETLKIKDWLRLTLDRFKET